MLTLQPQARSRKPKEEGPWRRVTQLEKLLLRSEEQDGRQRAEKRQSKIAQEVICDIRLRQAERDGASPLAT